MYWVVLGLCFAFSLSVLSKTCFVCLVPFSVKDKHIEVLPELDIWRVFTLFVEKLIVSVLHQVGDPC